MYPLNLYDLYTKACLSFLLKVLRVCFFVGLSGCLLCSGWRSGACDEETFVFELEQSADDDTSAVFPLLRVRFFVSSQSSGDVDEGVCCFRGCFAFVLLRVGFVCPVSGNFSTDLPGSTFLIFLPAVVTCLDFLASRVVPSLDAMLQVLITWIIISQADGAC